jgi:hypothetical protein
VTLLALVLIFVVGPIVELYVIIQVAHVIGGWETIALLLVESFIGAWLMKAQGRGALRRLTGTIGCGRAVDNPTDLPEVRGRIGLTGSSRPPTVRTSPERPNDTNG